MWYFQERCSSNKNSKDFMDHVLPITLFPIFNVNNFKGILFLIGHLWINVYFVFFIFKGTLMQIWKSPYMFVFMQK